MDHDLGDGARGTGSDVILWIEEVVGPLTAENDRGRSNDCA
ncbi:hypothetical protein AB4Y42_35020 [Paraburkholderia sp. EG286B]